VRARRRRCALPCRPPKRASRPHAHERPPALGLSVPPQHAQAQAQAQAQVPTQAQAQERRWHPRAQNRFRPAACAPHPGPNPEPTHTRPQRLTDPCTEREGHIHTRLYGQSGCQVTTACAERGDGPFCRPRQLSSLGRPPPPRRRAAPGPPGRAMTSSVRPAAPRTSAPYPTTYIHRERERKTHVHTKNKCCAEVRVWGVLSV
jgi:hypothetical protein